MNRKPIESRIGNLFLAVLDVAYFLSAGTILAYYVVSNWGSNTLVDVVLQGALVVALIASVFFMRIAARNLRLKRQAAPAPKSPQAQEHRTTAATAS